MNKLYRIRAVNPKREFSIDQFEYVCAEIFDDGKLKENGYAYVFTSYDQSELAKFPVNAIIEVEIRAK